MSTIEDFFSLGAENTPVLEACFTWTTDLNTSIPVLAVGFNKVLYNNEVYNNIQGLVLESDSTFTFPEGTYTLCIMGDNRSHRDPTATKLVRLIRLTADESVLDKSPNEAIYYSGLSTFICRLTFSSVTNIEIGSYISSSYGVNPLASNTGDSELWAKLIVKKVA